MEKVVCWQKKKGSQEFCFGQVRFETFVLHPMNVNWWVGAGYGCGCYQWAWVFRVTGMKKVIRMANVKRRG